MCTHYPLLGHHSVDAGIAEEEEAEGGAEGGFAEKGFKEGVVEGRILKSVAEEGINENEGLEKRGEKFEEGGITLSVCAGRMEALDTILAEAFRVAVMELVAGVVVAAAVMEEQAVENGEGVVEGGDDNGDDNAQGKAKADAKAEAEGDGDSNGVGDGKGEGGDEDGKGC